MNFNVKQIVVSPIDGMMYAERELATNEQIEAALAAENGNQTRAAKRLGISRRALLYKIAKYGLRLQS